MSPITAEAEIVVAAVTERPRLVQLMGYPAPVEDEDYDQDDITPNWDEVLEHLIANPSEASYKENGEHPLDDALWITNDPVPADVVIRLLRAYPQGLTAHSFELANENPHTSDAVWNLLRGADVDSLFTTERTELVKLMGYPPYFIDQDYEQEDVNPDWDAVRKRLVTHPEEASVPEDGCYPLADALWIESSPVPMDIVNNLVKLCPEGLTDQAFENASNNEELDGDMLRILFKADREIQRKTDATFVKL